MLNIAGILEQYGEKISRNRLVVPACQATEAGGIDSFESKNQFLGIDSWAP
jgi:hypothetical protein